MSAASALLVSAGLVAVDTAAYAKVLDFHTSLDASKVYESILYLTNTYGVSRTEALRRLELQNDAQKMDVLLRKYNDADYGGVWIDQDNGGILQLQMTKPAAAEPYLRKLPDRQHVKVVPVEHALSELISIKERLGRAVGEGPDATYLPALDTTNNRVVLWERQWVKEAKLVGTWDAVSGKDQAWKAGLPAAKAPAKTSIRFAELSSAERQQAVGNEQSAAAVAVASEHGTVVNAVLKQSNQLFTPYVDWGICHPLYCSVSHGGMRGGLRLNIQRDTGDWGGCTSGFNVRSRGRIWDGWAWVLTAGHCVVGKTNQTYIQHNGWPILLQHGVERNSYPYDYAVLPYIDGTRSGDWLENQSRHNRVLTYCRNNGYDSDSDTPCGPQATSYDTNINGYYNLYDIRAGWVVCATGTGSHTDNYPDSYTSGSNSGYLVGTRCGKVLSTDVGINTDICARAGDSGGPLFSQMDNTAYGILEGNQQYRSGPCYSGERNNYSPISAIFSDINYGYQDLVSNYDTSMFIIYTQYG